MATYTTRVRDITRSVSARRWEGDEFDARVRGITRSVSARRLEGDVLYARLKTRHS